MNRHLLPDEIDQLLDGEVGFGTTPLKAHVRSCAHCRAQIEEAHTLVRMLEHLPHFRPSHTFEMRVLSRVQVFVPWHVTLLDTVRGWMPSSRPARLAVGSALASAAAVMTIATLWVVSNLDAVLYATGLALGRLREQIVTSVGDVVAGSLGEPIRDAVLSGGLVGFLLAGTTLVFLAALATRVVRALSAPRTR